MPKLSECRNETELIGLRLAGVARWMEGAIWGMSAEISWISELDEVVKRFFYLPG